MLGLLGSLINGSIWPLFALLFGEILGVFARPADEVLSATHLWAGLFIVLGVVSGVGVFLKVHRTVCVCICMCAMYMKYLLAVSVRLHACVHVHVHGVCVCRTYMCVDDYRYMYMCTVC